MRIVLFRGSGQYGTPELYVDALDEAFQRQDHETLVIDLTEEPVIKDMADQMVDFGTNFSVSLNGIYPPTVDGQDFYDLLNIPHVSFLIDHPFHHLHRFANPFSDKLLVSCVDRTHLDYLEFYGDETSHACVLPHAVKKSEIDRGTPETFEHDLLFFGTVKGPKQIKNSINERLSSELKALVSDVSSELLNQPNSPVFKALREKFTEYGIEDLIEDMDVMQTILGFTERLFRKTARKQLIKTLSGGPLEIYGQLSGEIGSPEETLDIPVHEGLSHDEMLSTMSKTKATLNDSCFFPEGSHKRVIDSLASGTPVFTTRSTFFEEEFAPFGVIEQFNIGDQNLSDSAQNVVDQQSEYRRRMEEAQDYIEANHTWETRAEQIIEQVVKAWG